VKNAGVGRKPWAAPRASLVQVLDNADMTSSSADSSSVADDVVTQSVPGSRSSTAFVSSE